MAKKSSQQGVDKDAAPPKPKMQNPSQPRKKSQKSQKSDKSQDPLQFEAPPDIAAPLPVKPTKKTRKSKIETETCFMYLSLHQDVVDAVSPFMSEPWFQETDTDDNYINYCETFVMGKFRCRNYTCTTGGWGSKKVTTVIKGYRGNGYSAVVYNQRCRSCKRLGTLTLDETSYVERLEYRLKKWAGVPVETPDYEPKKAKPHRSDLCEGCKEGVCPLGKL